MEINFILNGKRRIEDIKPDTVLLDLLRKLGCYSVKRGCDSSNCGICTVFVDDRPVLSCRVLAASIDSHNITTLEGLQDEAEEFGAFIADQGAEQCGFCNPGFMMNAIALLKDNPDPSDDDIREYLSGNLCRCSGYESQMRGIKAYVAYKKEAKDE